ncbi:clostripain-related cysteine peptidase [Spirochaetota bacterium]
MIYMGADNNLEPYAIDDINEMEKGIANAIESGNSDINENMNVIVLFDRASDYISLPTEKDGRDWEETRLYRIKPDYTDSQYFKSERLDGGCGFGHIDPIGEMNLADPSTLDWFIQYSKYYFPADKYSLIIWSHGSGIQKSRSIISNLDVTKQVVQDNDDFLYIDEVQQAIQNNFNNESKLEFIGFDACYMGMVEVAYEFRNLSKYMIASMNDIQVNGWDYESLFGNLINSRDETVIGSDEFAALIVGSYKEYIENNYNNLGQTLSATDLSNMENLKIKIDAFAVEIDSYVDDNISRQSEIESIRDVSVNFYNNSIETSVNYPFYDLYDFCNRISSDVNNSFPVNLKTTADNVIVELENSIVVAYGDSGNPGNGGSEYYGNGTSVKRGLSIFFSRGNYNHEGFSHYKEHWWYTNEDTLSWKPGYYYGKVDFCDSDNNGTVEYWREILEKWYDADNNFTPSSF